MENDKRTGDWVEERLSVLTPSEEWRPDTGRGWSRLQQRKRTRHGLPAWTWAAAAGGALAALLALPGSRAVAQRVWDSVILKRVAVIPVNLDDLPESAKSLRAEIVRRPGPAQPAQDSGEAARLAGFSPRLPRPMTLNGNPKLSVLGIVGARLKLDRADLERTLSGAGVSDLTVPADWDGALIGAEIGPMVMAEWPDVMLMQTSPITLVTPAGFDLARLAEMTFRILKVGPQEARELARKFAANPGWFFGVPPEDRVEMREVALNSGAGMMIRDFDDSGQPERVALLWSTSDRIYMLSGKMSENLAVTVANSLQ